MTVSYRQGRLLDHVHLRVADLAASKRFYITVLQALGLLDGFGEGEGCFFVDELFVDVADGRRSSVHIAFQARDEAAVRKFFELGLQSGGRDNGAPGPRAYHPNYFSAFLLDPDGNNIEAVWHGPTTRSAESILIERKP